MPHALRTATALLAVAAGFAVAAQPAASAPKPGVRTICVEDTYAYEDPGVHFTGTLFEGNTLRVKRYSPSGKLAYGFARGRVNRHVWVKAAALCK